MSLSRVYHQTLWQSAFVSRRCASTLVGATKTAASSLRPRTTPPRGPSGSWRAKDLVYPVLLTSAVTSLAINLRNARDEARIQAARHEAQISVLTALIGRLEQGEIVAESVKRREYERCGLSQKEGREVGQRSIGWREMLFGRKKELHELEQEREEIEGIEMSLADAMDPTPSPSALKSAQAILDQVQIAEQAALVSEATTRRAKQDPPASLPSLRTSPAQNNTSSTSGLLI